MGIKSIEIEGFGPFIQRQRMPIAPLTMIFGPNSTGKTSFFRAIHHAQHCILKDEVPSRESALCPGFDLLEPHDRANDSEEPHRKRSKVRFVSEGIISDSSVLPDWACDIPLDMPYMEVVTESQYSIAGYESEEYFIEIGMQGEPLFIPRVRHGIRRAGKRFALNLRHPAFAETSDDFIQSVLSDDEIQVPVKDRGSYFGIIDLLIPSVRSTLENLYLEGSKDLESFFSVNPQRCISYREGGHVIDAVDINEWVNFDDESIDPLGDIRLYQITSNMPIAKEYPGLIDAWLVLQLKTPTDEVRFVALIFDSESQVNGLVYQVGCGGDTDPRNAEREPEGLDNVIRHIAHPSEKAGEKSLFGMRRTAEGCKEMFFLKIEGLLSKNHQYPLSITDIQLYSIMGRSRDLQTHWRDIDFRLSVDLLYQILSSRNRSRDWDRAAFSVSQILWAYLRSIFVATIQNIGDIIHVGPLRKTIRDGEPIQSNCWYDGRSAWLPSTVQDELYLSDMNSIFSHIGIQYELVIDRHRGAQKFIDWLKDGARVGLHESIDPAKWPTDSRYSIDDFESGEYRGLFNQFAEWLDIWSELGVFERGYGSDDDHPDTFSLSLLDRYRFKPITGPGTPQASSSTLGYDISQLGEGVRQIFPIIRAVISSTKYFANRLSIIQQPELHLHPRMQLGIADVLIAYRNCTIIETHSEHIILRVLKRIAETAAGMHKDKILAITPGDVSVVYLQPPPIQEAPSKEAERAGVKAVQLRITEEGDFLDPWPHGFFEERLEDLFSDECLDES